MTTQPVPSVAPTDADFSNASAMAAPWMHASAALPKEGAAIEFILQNREAPMHGVYRCGRFESRWYDYAPPKVCQWRDRVVNVRKPEAPKATDKTPGSKAAMQYAHRQGTMRTMRVN